MRRDINCKNDTDGQHKSIELSTKAVVYERNFFSSATLYYSIIGARYWQSSTALITYFIYWRCMFKIYVFVLIVLLSRSEKILTKTSVGRNVRRFT